MTINGATSCTEIEGGELMRTQKKLPEFSSQAKKAIEKLDVKAKARIKDGILGIPEGDIVPLQGIEDSYRLRVGKWRIIFRWINDEQIFIQKVSPRGDAYKGA